MKSPSLNKKVALALTKELVKRHGTKWGLKSEIQAEYIPVMSRRLRNAVHDWELSIKNKASWALALLPGDDDDDAEESDGSAADDEAEQITEAVEYGWDEELLLGWRAKPKAKKKRPRTFARSCG